MPDPIRFRPHHFLCALGYEGKGYSNAFTANMTAIVMGQLRAANGDEIRIEVVDQTDSICTPCPKRRGQLCTSQEKITALDQRHAKALQIQKGDILTWAEAQHRIVEHVPPGGLKTLCKGCEWLYLGLCNAALERLHQTQNAAPQDDV